MGNCVGGFKRRTTRIAPWRRNRSLVLCFLGIDGAGKTTIVKALQGEDFATVHPTMGFSRAEVNVKKYKVTVFDLGGSQRIRDIWPTYFAEVYGLVFVVDSSAASRLQENKSMVDSLCDVPELQNKPILFLLNKKDLPEAMDEMQFSERFGLHSMAKRNRTDIRVEGVCAVKGTGKEIDQVIVEGLEWLIEKILDNYDQISKGVEQALKKLREKQAQERLERQHRLALAAARTAEEVPEAPSRPQSSGENVAAPEAELAESVVPSAGQEGRNGDLPPIRGGSAKTDGQRAQTSHGERTARPATSGSKRPATGASGKIRAAAGEAARPAVDFAVFEIGPDKMAANQKRSADNENPVEELELQERGQRHGSGEIEGGKMAVASEVPVTAGETSQQQI